MSLPRTFLFATLGSITITLLAFGAHTVSGRQFALALPADARTPCTQETRISLDNIEKFNWSWCKLDLHPFWNGLQIPVGRFTESRELFDTSSTYGDIDGDGIDERILHLRLSLNKATRIVVLKPPTAQTSRWRTVAFMDLDTFHLYPEARVVTNGRGLWLAISHIEKAWGTGIFQENENWYELSNGQFREVEGFPIEGKISQGGPGLASIEVKFTASVDMSRFDGSKDAINVRYTTTLGDFADLPIRTTVRFTKAPAGPAFAFDSAGSTISRGDYTTIFNLAPLTHQRFLTFAYPTLRVMAQRDGESRDWVRELLQSCDATTQKVCAELRSALQSKPRR